MLKIKNKNCLFCEVVHKIKPGYILYESKTVLVILDIFPVSNGHALVLTKKCVPNISHLEPQELLEIQLATQKTIKLLQKHLNVPGFNLVNNYNAIAGQVINHYHLHIIPKYTVGNGVIFTKITNKSELRANVEKMWRILTKNGN